MSEQPIIILENVNKWFGDLHVLQDVSLSVGKKERIVVCGPSGSGKSTMIRCINRLEEHQEGKIVVDGIELTGNLKNIDSVKQFLSKINITYAVLGKFTGDQINIRRKSKHLAKFKINLAQKRYFNGLEDLLKHG